MTTDSNCKHPHAILPRESVLKLRIIQKSTVFISDLPKTMVDAQILSSKQYFGQFGDIVDIALSSSSINNYWTKITYNNPQSAMSAINYVNNVFTNTLCKATYGYQRYCQFWLDNYCTNPNCNFLHSWCNINELNNVMTAKMLKRFASFGINNKFGLTSTQLQSNDQQKQIAQLTTQLQQTQHSLSNVLQSYNTLKVKYESLEIKYCDLENKYLVLCMDEKNLKKSDCYLSWDSADIYNWIMTIHNGHFNKYKELFMNLLNEEIDGECLTKLDRNDLHRLGIKKFNDKILLLDSILNLVDNNGDVIEGLNGILQND